MKNLSLPVGDEAAAVDLVLDDEPPGQMLHDGVALAQISVRDLERAIHAILDRTVIGSSRGDGKRRSEPPSRNEEKARKHVAHHCTDQKKEDLGALQGGLRTADPTFAKAPSARYLLVEARA